MATKTTELVRCTILVLMFSLFVCTCQAKKAQSTLAMGTDCTQIKKQFPEARSGVYMIQPPGITKTFKVYCKMQSNGGWTVFQQRTGGKVKFNRRWFAYKNGFGNIHGDHWLGLQKLWSIMRGRKWTMRVDLWDFEGNTAFARYKNFKLGGEGQAYKLQVGAYSGTAGDAIRGTGKITTQNGYGFSTKDRDNDGCSPCLFADMAENSCSQWVGYAGWWFSRCGLANLNGEWHPQGRNIGWRSGLHWGTWRGPTPYSARATRMMIKAE